MRKMVLEIPEAEKIDINGDIFEIRRSDADILNRCLDLRQKYESLTLLAKERNAETDVDDVNNINNVEAVKNTVNETIALIDEILIPKDADSQGGYSAFQKISRGRPVNIAAVCGWLIAICGEINKINDDYINDKYE